MNDATTFPLNIIKEKLILSLPQNTEIENSAVVGMEIALREFLTQFTSEIKIDDKNGERKLMVKEIKENIEKSNKYQFLQGLLDNNQK